MEGNAGMFEEYYAPLPDLGAYLERIGLAGTELRQNLETLDRVIEAHVQTVPFENLDACLAHRAPDLTVEGLFDKVVRRRRGGWCHELNGLLLPLLRALGFDCRAVAGRISVSADAVSPLGHRAVLCLLNGERYYCDVGFGDVAVRSAVPLSGAETRFGFHAERDGDWYALWRGGRRLLLFSDLPFEPTDFLAPNFRSALAPGEKFNQAPYVSIMRGDARLLLRGGVLTRQEPGRERETLAEGLAGRALRETLRREFGIEGAPGL